MFHFKQFVPVAAALATILAAPTAAAGSVCVGAGYSLLGSGTDIQRCVSTGWSTITHESSTGDPGLVEVRTTVTVPVPVVVPPEPLGTSSATATAGIVGRSLSGHSANRPI